MSGCPLLSAIDRIARDAELLARVNNVLILPEKLQNELMAESVFYELALHFTRGCNIRTDVVLTGTEAYELIEKTPYDAFITGLACLTGARYEGREDTKGRITTGAAVLSDMRELEHGKDLLTMVLTSVPDTPARESVIANGAVYVNFPVATGEVLEKLYAELEQRDHAGV